MSANGLRNLLVVQIDLRVFNDDLMRSWFDELIIPGDEDGFAIALQTDSIEEVVSAGLSNGTPVLETQRYGGRRHSTTLSLTDFNSMMKSVQEIVRLASHFSETDILDGQSYLIRCRQESHEQKSILMNPQGLPDPDIARALLQLKLILKKAKKPWWKLW